MVEQSLISALPQLGVGVASVAALVYVITKFLAFLEQERQKYIELLNERERAMRALEGDIRNNMATHLMESSVQMAKNSQLMERVIDFLRGHIK